MRTIKDLKNYLNDLLEKLENVDEEKELELKQNTYWCKGDFLSITGDGFVDLSTVGKNTYKCFLINEDEEEVYEHEIKAEDEEEAIREYEDYLYEKYESVFYRYRDDHEFRLVVKK